MVDRHFGSNEKLVRKFENGKYLLPVTGIQDFERQPR